MMLATSKRSPNASNTSRGSGNYRRNRRLTAFICWTFQPSIPIWPTFAAGAYEYLTTNAVARLYLNNFPNIQSSWVTQGLKIGQLACSTAPTTWAA